MSGVSAAPWERPDHLSDAAIEHLRKGQTRPASKAFSSDLSVDEAILIEEAGYEPKGLVSGSSVFHIGYVTSWVGSAEVPELSTAMARAREIAISRLVEDGRRIGGDGVVGVQLDISMLGSHAHLAEFIAVGTSIAMRKSAQKRHHLAANFFTSNLSGKDFYLLSRAGYQPLGLVMGSCVYHVSYQSVGSWAKMQSKNVELTNVTEALYAARELAMARMQSEAILLGADGVVGVTTEEKSHVWGSHMIEFFALGTAIKLVSSEHRMLGLVASVPLEDQLIATDPSAITGRRKKR